MAEHALEDILRAIAEDQVNNLSRCAGLRDLIAALIADRANQSANLLKALDQFATDERDAAYLATALDDGDHPFKDRMREVMAETKETVFALACGIVASRHR